MQDAGFAYFAARDPDFIAIIEPDGREWSRGALDALVNRLAGALVAAGVVPGDALAIVAPNCAEYLAAYLAGIQTGLMIVPVNWHLAEPELAFVIENSEAKVIIAHERLGAVRLAAIAARRLPAQLLLVIGTAPGFTPLRDFIATPLTSAPPPVPLGRVMAYTSATTGRPKAVLLPRANGTEALARIIAWHRSLGIEPEDANVHLCASMLYHSAPLEGATTALQMGHRVVLADGWQPERILRLIERHRVTTAFMVPTLFVRLLKLDRAIRARYSTATLRFVIHAGAPCPIAVKRQMIAWWGPIIWESYGAAEGQGAIVDSEQWLRYPGTVGRPIPGAAIRICDDAGRDLPPNTVGMIYLRPYTGDRFAYKDDPERTRACYRGDFITVGDFGYLNDDGYLFLCDRRVDLIISSGMNIYPAEIEGILIQHPRVTDCAVIGEPHPLLGEAPVAFVEAARGVTTGASLSADILHYLGQHLSAMKLPKRIRYIEAIPRDPNGKLRRRLLRDRDRPPDRQ